MHEITCPLGHSIARTTRHIRNLTLVEPGLFTAWAKGQPPMLHGQLIPVVAMGKFIMPINSSAHCAVCGDLWVRSMGDLASVVGFAVLHPKINQIFIDGSWQPTAFRAGTREVVEDDLLPV